MGISISSCLLFPHVGYGFLPNANAVSGGIWALIDQQVKKFFIVIMVYSE